MKSFPISVHLVFLYLCMSSSLLKGYLHTSASLAIVYSKCKKKMVAEIVASLMSLLLCIKWRVCVMVMTMIVFVNQMLLMRAGDVERNPGPGKVLSR